MQDLRGAAELVARDLRRAGPLVGGGVRCAIGRRRHQRQSARRRRAERRARRRRCAQLDRGERGDERRRQRAVRLSPAQRRDRDAARRAQLAGAERPGDRRRHVVSGRTARRRRQPGRLLRRALRERQHGLPAAPARAQLRDLDGRALGGRRPDRARRCRRACALATTSSSAAAKDERHVRSLSTNAASPRSSSRCCSASR